MVRCWQVLVVSFASSLSAVPSEKAQWQEFAQEIERIEQLTFEEQEKEIPRVYREMHMVFHGECPIFPVLGEPLWVRSSKLLRMHPRIVEPLVKSDLQGGQKAIDRALQVIRDLQLKEFFDDVVAIFAREDDSLAGRAALTLGDLNDPRAICLLVDKDPLNPMRYFQEIQALSQSRPADPAVVKHLYAKDANIRWRAAFALAGCRDDAMIPEIERLTKDVDPRVRAQAGIMGFSLKLTSFARVRPLLITLLSDKDPQVRVQIACIFAWKRDQVCARALLKLLKDESLDQSQISRIRSAVHDLTGTYFGHGDGDDSVDWWRPTTKKNQAAIQRFLEWIERTAEPAR